MREAQRAPHTAPPALGAATASRVAVAGLGAVCPAGRGVEALWQALFEPPCPPTHQALPTLPDDGRAWRHAHALPDRGRPAPHDHARRRFDALAIDAMTQACADAGLDPVAWHGVSLGIALGTAAGDTAASEHAAAAGLPMDFTDGNPYAVTDRLAQALGQPVDGPVFTVANACAAALHALAQATDLILDGLVDAMLVVGVELLSHTTQAGLQRMTALDPARCRPFDAKRQGTVLGEGAAALLLVSHEVAVRLGLQPPCWVAGHGMSCDAHHPTAPQPEGRDIEVAMQQALQAAGLTAADMSLVVPHGTGTPMNDRVEGELLQAAFGAAAPSVPLLPIKAHLGHCAGASGALSAVVAARAIASGTVPPSLYMDSPDPALSLGFPQQAAALPAHRPHRALVNAYGFGGNNVTVILEGACHA